MERPIGETICWILCGTKIAELDVHADSVSQATNTTLDDVTGVALWHNPDLRTAAHERPFTSTYRTLGAEGLLSGRNPTVF